MTFYTACLPNGPITEHLQLIQVGEGGGKGTLQFPFEQKDFLN